MPDVVVLLFLSMEKKLASLNTISFGLQNIQHLK